jgi:hypothetical protein
MPRPTQPVAVQHPDVPGAMIALDPGHDYDPGDPLVRAYPWAFVAQDAPRVLEEVVIEQATAAPGEKRARRSSR